MVTNDKQNKVSVLGRGLSALVSENNATDVVTAIPENTSSKGLDVCFVKASSIASNKYQPRTVFDQRELNELANSIRADGILQPILVRSNSGDSQQQYEIVSGERRWRASILAGLSEVPVIIREMNDSDALKIALIENIQRKDLNPVEEALGYKRLVDEFEYKQVELAEVVGKSRAHIANMLRMLSLPDEVLDMIRDDKITFGHAKVLVGTENCASIASRVVSNSLSVRQTEQLIKSVACKEVVISKDSISNDKGGSNDEFAETELLLSKQLKGMRVTINSETLSISYKNLHELDFLLERLGISD